MSQLAWVLLFQMIGMGLGVYLGQHIAKSETVETVSQPQQIKGYLVFVAGCLGVLAVTATAVMMALPHLPLALVTAAIGSLLYIPFSLRHVDGDDDSPIEFGTILKLIFAFSACIAFLSALFVLINPGGFLGST